MWIEVDLLFAFTSIFDLFTRLSQEKSHSRKRMAFLNEAHLRCMKNEAGLLPMKRAFGTRRIYRALRFTFRLRNASWRQRRRFIATKLRLHFPLFPLQSPRICDTIKPRKAMRQWKKISLAIFQWNFSLTLCIWQMKIYRTVLPGARWRKYIIFKEKFL